MSKKGSNLRRRTALFLVASVVAGCDPFSVSDPARFTDDDLDLALDAVANGVEGAFHLTFDGYITADVLLSDVMRHTGTWADYEDAYQGRYRYGNSGGNGKPDGVFNEWLRARYAAVDAQKRFTRLGVPDSDPKVIQVKTVEAFIDLYLGEAWCEAPADSGGAAVADAQMIAQAISKLTAARSLAQQANSARWINYTTAGLARANLLAGNYGVAAGLAAQVLEPFNEVAKFSLNSTPQYNSMVNLNTVGFNKAAGMRDKWFTQVDTVASMLKDPYTGQLDSRVEIRHPAKTLGVDGKTQHYSQWKYKGLADDIPITHWREMRLIEAEADYRAGQLDAAVAKLDALRGRAGVALGPLPPHGGIANTVRDYLLHERFAELFMEGHRMPDLHRFGVVATTPGLGAGRITRFPLSQTEAIWNPNIEDNAAQRCAPIS